MTAVTTEESPSPSVIGSTVGSPLPRRITERIVRDFREMFPGMPAFHALEMGRAFVADPEGFRMKVSREFPTMRLDRLDRLMSELPLGLTHGIDAQSRAIRVPRGQEAR